MAKPSPLRRAFQALRKRALAYPETREDFPWDHSAIKVRKKVFLFLHGEKGTLGVTLKLPNSAPDALRLPFAESTGYGLGKHGWITARFNADDDIPVEMLLEWLDESFRAVAPKKLVAQL